MLTSSVCWDKKKKRKKES